MSREVIMTSGRQVAPGMVALGAGVALAGAGIAALLAWRSRGSVMEGRPSADPMLPLDPGHGDAVNVLAARRLNRAAGLLAVSVLADSALEHYRGSFANPAMYAPLVVSLLSVGLSAHGLADKRSSSHPARDTIYVTSAMTGIIGTAFHVYNVASRPGRFRWENFFYGAPLGAPAAILLSGSLGYMAERVRDTPAERAPRFAGMPAGRLTAGITAVGLLGTTAEAGLLHFRGAFHNPFMVLPVTIPPSAAAVMAGVALGTTKRDRAFSRWWLRITAALGFAGAAFHAFGVHRNMGGWHNWRQNILNGPPIPAPPSFAGLALAGLAAIALTEEQPDA